MVKLLEVILILWAGLVLGVSFIATPVKFMAKSLSMPTALDVGRVTFHAFNKVEWVFFAITLLIALFNTKSLGHLLCLAALGALLCFETFYLLKELDIRVMRIIAGEAVKPRMVHWLYVAADALKVIMLLTSGWFLMRLHIRN